jgi:hypothetical protein
MAKKGRTRKSKGQKLTPSRKRAAAATRGGKRRTAGAKTPKGKARRKQAKNTSRPGKLKGSAKRSTRAAASRTGRKAASRPASRRGGTGREETLAQTPETGRTRLGPTNPMPTRRSTGTPAGAGTIRAPRRVLRLLARGLAFRRSRPSRSALAALRCGGRPPAGAFARPGRFLPLARDAPALFRHNRSFFASRRNRSLELTGVG